MVHSLQSRPCQGGLCRPEPQVVTILLWKMQRQIRNKVDTPCRNCRLGVTCPLGHWLIFERKTKRETFVVVRTAARRSADLPRGALVVGALVSLQLVGKSSYEYVRK